MNTTMTTRVAAGVTATYLLDLSRDAARTTGSEARRATGRSREHGRSADARATLRRRPTPAHGSRRRGDRAASAPAPAPAACAASVRRFPR